MKITVSATDFKLPFYKVGSEIAEANTKSFRKISKQTKDEIRAEVKTNFKRTPQKARRYGQDFLKSFQVYDYPSNKKKKSLSPAAFVVANANFSEVFEKGMRIHGNMFLALPTRNAIRLGLDRGFVGSRFKKVSMTEKARDMFGDAFFAVRTKKGNTVLAVKRQALVGRGVVFRGKSEYVPLFILVRSVRIGKKLNIEKTAERNIKKLAKLILAEL